MEVRYWHPNLDVWLAAIETFVAGGAAQAFADRIAVLNAEEREVTPERDLAYPILSQVAEDARWYYGGDVELDDEDLDEPTLRERMKFARDALRALQGYATARKD